MEVGQISLCISLKGDFEVTLTNPEYAFGKAVVRIMERKLLEKYISKVRENFNLSNVMLTVLFIDHNEKVKFIQITFWTKQAGVNSINIRKITKIGIWKLRTL